MTLHPRIKAALADTPWRKAVAKVELRLPLPPSTNALTYNRSKKQLGIAKAIGHPLPGRGKTDRYLTWLRAAGNELNAQRPVGRIPGAYAITITVGADAPGDIGNREKALSDFLQSMGVVDNDRLADSVFISRSEHVEKHQCLVTVAPAERARTQARKAA